MKTSTSKKPARKKAKSAIKRSPGSLSRAETTKLLLQARDAFHYQIALKNVPADAKFDTWRKAQVQESVQKGGLSQLNRDEWRTVSAHFLTLGGCEDEAFEVLNKTGEKSYRSSGPDDIHESCEALVAKIREELESHSKVEVSHPKGIIHTGWFLAAARQCTGKPTLTMATLADRLDPKTLTGLLSHLRNHIAVREGREQLDRRSRRVYPKKPDPNVLDEPF